MKPQATRITPPQPANDAAEKLGCLLSIPVLGGVIWLGVEFVWRVFA